MDGEEFGMATGKRINASSIGGPRKQISSPPVDLSLSCRRHVDRDVGPCR